MSVFSKIGINQPTVTRGLPYQRQIQTGIITNTMLFGTVNPTSDDGVDGDLYLNITTFAIFGPKANGAWSLAMTLSTILNGTVDPTTEGVDGDFYINTIDSTFFGPKASGSWPTEGVSLIGANGNNGIDFGQYFTYSSTTSSTSIAHGQIRFNNATISSATEMYMSKYDNYDNNLQSLLTLSTDGVLYIHALNDYTKLAVIQFKDITVDFGGYIKSTNIFIPFSTDNFSDTDVIVINIVPTNPVSYVAPKFIFNDATSDADPGSGYLAFNGDLTEMYVSKTSESMDLSSFLGFINTYDYLYVRGLESTFKCYVLRVIGTPTAHTDYYTIPIQTDAAGSTTFSADDKLTLLYVPRGLTGATGDTGSTGAPGGNAGLKYKYSSIATEADPGSNYFRKNNAGWSSVTKLFIDSIDADDNNVSAILNVWPEPASVYKGYLYIQSKVNNTFFAVFKVVDVTDNTGWFTVDVEYIMSTGSYNADDVMALLFVPIGDKGDAGNAGNNGYAQLLDGVDLTSDSADIDLTGFTLHDGDVAILKAYLTSKDSAMTGSIFVDGGTGTLDTTASNYSYFRRSIVNSSVQTSDGSGNQIAKSLGGTGNRVILEARIFIDQNHATIITEEHIVPDAGSYASSWSIIRRTSTQTGGVITKIRISGGSYQFASGSRFYLYQTIVGALPD